MTTIKVVTYGFACDYRAGGRRCQHQVIEIDGMRGVVGARREARQRGWTFTTGERWARQMKSWCPDHGQQMEDE